jgi:hypothetical protein
MKRGRREAHRMGFSREPGERWTRFAARVANAFGVVLLLVALTYVAMSLIPYNGWTAVLLAALPGASATVALASAGARHALVRTAAALAVISVVLAAVVAIAGGPALLATSALLVVGLLVVAAGEVLHAVISEEEVGFRTILGAISVYIILGLLFAFLYAAIDKFQSGPFFGVETDTGDIVFFSITTLTTTGYGNLVPAGQPGRMLSGLEMLIGQVFLVTLIAGLVSLWRPSSWRRQGGDG